MRALLWVPMVLLACAPSRLSAQTEQRGVPTGHAWSIQPLPASLVVNGKNSGDSTRHRPFYLPRPGEHTAYWIGFGTGAAVSPLLWCEGASCGVLRKATISLLSAGVGALSGLLLTRAL